MTGERETVDSSQRGGFSGMRDGVSDRCLRFPWAMGEVEESGRGGGLIGILAGSEFGGI